MRVSAVAVAFLVFNEKSLGAQGGAYLAVLILIVLVNGLTLCAAGAAGLLLNRRGQ